MSLAVTMALMAAAVPGVRAATQHFSFKVASLSGGTLADEDFRGKILVVDIWATWCGPCRMVIPHLVKIQEQYKVRGVAVLGLNSDDDAATGPGRDAVARFVRETGINYPIGLMNPETYAEVSRVMGSSPDSGFSLPTTIVLSRDGRVVRRYPGYFHGQERELEEVINGILGSEAPAAPAKP